MLVLLSLPPTLWTIPQGSSDCGLRFSLSAASMAVKGDVIADLTEEIWPRSKKARVTYDNILRLCDDPDVTDVIRFLREREVVHFQRFGEAVRLAKRKKWIRKIFTSPIPLQTNNPLQAESGARPIALRRFEIREIYSALWTPSGCEAAHSAPAVTAQCSAASLHFPQRVCTSSGAARSVDFVAL